MQILGHGIDVVSISRFRQTVERQGDSFLQKIFSKQERSYCKKKQDPIPHYAVRFGAKEAYSKALGLGLGRVGEVQELAVVHDALGAPALELCGRAKKVFTDKGGEKIFLSLAHDGDSAIASVIIWGKQI